MRHLERGLNVTTGNLSGCDSSVILETEFAKHGSFDLAYKLAVYLFHTIKGFRLAAIQSPGKKHNSFHASCQRRTSGSRPLVKQWESGGRAVVERYPSLG